MRLTVGSILNVTPIGGGWTAHFIGPDESWSYPVIGWATVGLSDYLSPMDGSS